MLPSISPAESFLNAPTPQPTLRPLATLIAHFEAALAEGSFVRFVLAKPRSAAATATAPEGTKVTIRPLTVKGRPRLAFVHTHSTRDETRHVDPAEGVAQVRTLLETRFAHAHLHTTQAEWQWLCSRRGKQTLIHTRAEHAAAPVAHDRAKHRHVTLSRPYLAALGVTDAAQQLIPAMARKWKQIDKFVEIIDHALDAGGLKTEPRLRVVDFGSGKGYLTFALHDHLRHALGIEATVHGIELRPDLVGFCNAAAERLSLDGLHFEQGDVHTAAPPAFDLMIALHACDTATDIAIAAGVRGGARLIVCSPCCHKELRPQLMTPHPLRPLLKHGVHLGQQAEMLTDGLRALLLEAEGYDTQVFEFVALEHTSKNKMILAVRREGGAVAREAETVKGQIEELKRFYGVRTQALERLLAVPRDSELKKYAASLDRAT